MTTDQALINQYLASGKTIKRYRTGASGEAKILAALTPKEVLDRSYRIGGKISQARKSHPYESELTRFRLTNRIAGLPFTSNGTLFDKLESRTIQHISRLFRQPMRSKDVT